MLQKEKGIEGILVLIFMDCDRSSKGFREKESPLFGGFQREQV